MNTLGHAHGNLVLIETSFSGSSEVTSFSNRSDLASYMLHSATAFDLQSAVQMHSALGYDVNALQMIKKHVDARLSELVVDKLVS